MDYKITWAQLPPHGRRMRAWMEKRGLTLEEFGALMKPPRTRQAVQRIMSCHGARRATLAPVARAMGITVESLCKRFGLYRVASLREE